MRVLRLCTICLFLITSLISCSSNQSSINENLDSKEIVNELSKLREEYSGDNSDLNDANTFANILLKRKEYVYEALVVKAWVTLRKGYINEGVGYKRENIISSYQIMGQAIELQKVRWKGWADLTNLYIKAKDFKRAELALRKFRGFNIDSNNQEFHYQDALLTMDYNNGLKNYKETQITYKQCSKFAMNKYQKRNCLHLLALSYPNNFQQVLKIRKFIIKLDTNSAWDFGNLGLAYLNIKNYDKAIELYEKAISIRKYGIAQDQLAFLYIVKARNLFDDGKKDKAHEFILKYRKMNFYTDYNVELVTKVIEKYLGNNKLILDILIEVEQSNANSGRVKTLIAEYYFKNKSYKKAREYFIEALSPDRINSQSPKFISYVGVQIALISMWRLENKEYDVAIKWLLQSSKKMKENNDYTSTFYFYLGSAYHEKSWIEKDIKLSKLALKNYKKALEFDDIKHDKIHANMRLVKANIRNFSKNM
ncbi:tetratricopeptide repeat protein [Halobacteriovorax sp. HFRX-2_2]|uniref:tetratricopeptide repeat protein n=1 Tax=unclassified Halobacteriovorax TaxID=2639665 RepID=UPI00371951DF